MITFSRAFDLTSSTLASQLRGWAGTFATQPAAAVPQKPLVLYDMENCPYCRLVRETLNTLELDVMVRPCPKGGTRFRDEAKALGAGNQYPLLVDPNTGTQLMESADIIDYLHSTYGRGKKAPRGLGRQLAVLSSMAASGMRPHRGSRVRPSRAPAEPLELYSFESSPFSRLVRELLCELEVPYLLRPGGKAGLRELGTPAMRNALFPRQPTQGRNRKALEARAGRVQFPYLVDPNVLGPDGEPTALFESADILAHLRRHYAAP